MALVPPWEWELPDFFIAAFIVYLGSNLSNAIDQSRDLAEAVFWIFSHALQGRLSLSIACFLYSPPGSPESRRAVDCASLVGLCLLVGYAWKTTNNKGLMFAAIFTGLYLTFFIELGCVVPSNS